MNIKIAIAGKLAEFKAELELFLELQKDDLLPGQTYKITINSLVEVIDAKPNVEINSTVKQPFLNEAEKQLQLDDSDWENLTNCLKDAHASWHKALIPAFKLYNNKITASEFDIYLKEQRIPAPGDKPGKAIMFYYNNFTSVNNKLKLIGYSILQTKWHNRTADYEVRKNASYSIFKTK